MEIKEFSTYRHLKSGNYYRLLTIAREEATGIHVAVYEDSDYNRWTRPLDGFKERFELVEDDPSQCVIPGCYNRRQGFFSRCKEHE